MKNILLSLTVLALMGCFESPRKDRREFQEGVSQTSGFEFNPGSENIDGQVLLGEGYNCSFSSSTFQHSSDYVGNFNICLNQDQVRAKVQFQAYLGNIGLCFIPLTVLDNGNSYHLGNAQCIQAGSLANRRVVEVPLPKNRTPGDYTALTTNAVLMIKDESYQFLPPYPGNEIEGTQAYVDCIAAISFGDQRYCNVWNQAGYYHFHRI